FDHKGFVPIGVDVDGNFTGTLDGNDNIITNLYMYNEFGLYIALFDTLGDPDNTLATVSDFGLENVDISASSWVGALAGEVYATVDNVWSSGAVTATDWGYIV